MEKTSKKIKKTNNSRHFEEKIEINDELLPSSEASMKKKIQQIPTERILSLKNIKFILKSPVAPSVHLEIIDEEGLFEQLKLYFSDIIENNFIFYYIKNGEYWEMIQCDIKIIVSYLKTNKIDEIYVFHEKFFDKDLLDFLKSKFPQMIPYMTYLSITNFEVAKFYSIKDIIDTLSCFDIHSSYLHGFWENLKNFKNQKLNYLE